MKTFKIKNYKGNLVESLKRFSDSHKDMKIVEAVEEDGSLKIKAESAVIKENDDLSGDLAAAKGATYFRALAKALEMTFSEDINNNEDFSQLPWSELVNFITEKQIAITPSEDFNKKFDQITNEFSNALAKL